MYTARIAGRGFSMARQFVRKRDAAAQCEDWANCYNDNVIHAFGSPGIGYVCFETEPGLYGDNICGVVFIALYVHE